MKKIFICSEDCPGDGYFIISAHETKEGAVAAFEQWKKTDLYEGGDMAIHEEELLP